MEPREKTYTARHRRRHRRYTVLSCLAAVVVFCTTYALILPAITLNWACGLEAHTHGEDCYDEQGALICDLEEHEHTEACRVASRELSYEDAELRITVRVESDEPLPEELSLAVETLEPALLLSDEEEQEDGLWLLRQLALLSGDEVLESGSYRMTAQVQVKPEALTTLAEELDTDEAAPEAELGIELGLYQLDDELGLRQMTEQLVAADETAEPFAVSVQDGLLAVRAVPTANPSYTVQYYANLPRFAESGDFALTVIDTSGKKLPKNNTTLTTKEVYLEKTDRMTDQNNGDDSYLYTVKTETTLTQIYSDNTYQYIKAPNTSYVDKLMDNESYVLKEVWVLTGSDPNSTNESDWDVYPSGVHFTNRELANSDGYVYIKDNTVLRLVYDTQDAEFSTSANFYDYDITSEQSNGKWLSGTTGINSSGNYGISTNGKRTWSSYNDVLAFGNVNCGTGMGNSKFDSRYLNKYSTTGMKTVPEQYGCTFGLAKSFDQSTGTIVYNDWLVTPRLFNEGVAVGKHSYENSQLNFTRVGDTYTLSSAELRENGTTLGEVKGLQEFFNPSTYNGLIYDGTYSDNNKQKKLIFTNNFWPLDKAKNKTDPLFGQYNNSVGYKGYEEVDRENGASTNWTAKEGTFPVSDDGNAHNSFFGMQYAVTFTLTADYVGPLEYYFFGDDDMWVFLDETLVCDIGGVHSSVGEYVDLWDYLQKEGRTESETHTLTFFYTERGASGSTCYMNFTLPSVSGVNLEQKTGDLKVSKTVQSETPVVGDPGYDFDIVFTDANDNPVPDDYAYTHYKNDGTTEDGLVLHSYEGEEPTCTLKAGEYIVVHNLPVGLKYKVSERKASAEGYAVSINGTIKEDRTAEGTVERENKAEFINIREHHTLTLIKEVQGIDTEQKFTFEISYILNGENKTETVSLGNKEEYNKLRLPVGTTITIKEPNHDGFSLGFTATGDTPTINPDGSCTVTLTQDTVITAVNTTGFELPNTGGPGTWLYTLGGSLLLMAAGALLLYKQRRKGGAESS